MLLVICFSKTKGQSGWCATNSTRSTNEIITSEIPFLSEIKNYLREQPLQERSEKWLPVVVHVVMDQPERMNYARVIQQIDVLNRDFAKKGDNIYKLNEEFVSIAADTDIRFCLASVDPDGNPTQGITYTQTNTHNIALARDMNGRYVVHYDQLGGKTGWDPERYINIWIAEFGNGILGYGSLPGTSPYPEEIGVVMDPHYFGSFGASPYYFDRGHSLTHEMGHFLGLLHIWGDDDGCEVSDGVEDTPNAAGFYVGCPSGTQTSCGVSNMYQNFMDLTDDRCLAAFTYGQAMHMQAAIDLFYPDLPMIGPCTNSVEDLDEWWQNLDWAYDPSSKEYILFTPQAFTGEMKIEIFSSDGKQIATDIINGHHSYLINLNGIPGVYFIHLNSGNKHHTRKIAIF